MHVKQKSDDNPFSDFRVAACEVTYDGTKWRLLLMEHAKQATNLEVQPSWAF
jgi:hypothetical protein